MSSSKKLIKFTEYYKSPIPLKEDERFTIEELEILESRFPSQIQVISRYTGDQLIRTQEYVGYLILPNHIVSITPKIPQISFINVVRYALGLVELKSEYFELSEESNYYDILVLFFF